MKLLTELSADRSDLPSDHVILEVSICEEYRLVWTTGVEFGATNPKVRYFNFCQISCFINFVSYKNSYVGIQT